MDIEQTREYCLSFPHATENVQWGNDLVFKIAGKMFAVIALDAAARYVMSCKATDEKFVELTEREGIDPAPYMARNKWVALQSFGAMRDKELKGLLRTSYDLVFAKLPKKTQSELNSRAERASVRKRR
jgi:predicted DNA-binding protein (MmcQ/YjbR family)